MKKYAVYTGSRNIYDDMLMSAKSLIAHSDVDKVYFFIEDDVFPEKLPSLIETRNVSSQEYFPSWGPNMKSRFTYFALMRAALAKEFPDYDRILALDCDILCVRDVSHLWELPIDEYYYAAAIEPHRSLYGLMYTNIGVTLQNLKKMRETGKVDEYIDVLNRQRFEFVDQDVLNYLSQGYVYEMHPEYNATNFTKSVQNPRIVHFAGLKREQWHNHPIVARYRNMSWDEIMSLRKQNSDFPT